MHAVDDRLRGVADRVRRARAGRPSRSRIVAERRHVAVGAVDHVGLDPEEVRDADVDAEVRDLDAQDVEQHLEAGLARPVRPEADRRRDRRGGRDAHDVAAALPRCAGGRRGSRASSRSRFTFSCAASASGSRWRSAPATATPAFEISTSIPPASSTTQATASATCSACVMSQARWSASSPHVRGGVRRARSAFRSSRATRWVGGEAPGDLEADALRGAGDDGDGAGHAATLPRNQMSVPGDPVLFEEAVVLALLDDGLGRRERDQALREDREQHEEHADQTDVDLHGIADGEQHAASVSKPLAARRPAGVPSAA